MARVGIERRPLGIADIALAVWIAILAAVTIYGAFTTTGFLTVSNGKAILTAASFVGIIAVGLTVIILSGNLFSLALGQTAAISAMVFLYSLRFGLAAAIIVTLLLGLAIGAVQGFAVGAWGANPIIITIGAAGLMEGMAVWLSHGQSIIPPSDETSWEHLGQPVLGLPAPVYVFIVVTVILAVVMRKTRFGRQIYLLGENRVAARAAALPITLLTVGAFGIASLYTAGAGILIGATSANASLLLVGSYTYDAIAAALVGGNAVTGGRGSIARTAAGCDLHRDDLGHAPPAGLLDGRPDPRSRNHRGRGRGADEPEGAEPMSTTETTRRRPRAGEAAPFAILAIMVVVLALVPVVTQYTVRTANVYDIFQNFASYGLVALALGITIIAGEFDLSVSSMYLLGGMVAVLTGGGSPIVGIAAALGTAILVGLVQGGLIARFRLNSMPVTLGGYLVVLGITYILGHNKSVLYDNFTVGLRIDKPVLQIFSIRSLVALAIFVVAAIVLRYLRVGRDLRAIGGDRRAARVAGVPVDRLLVGVFVVAALGAALPGALLSYSLATASPTNIGFDVLTFSATAALIGGVRLSGGKGGAVGIAAGRALPQRPAGDSRHPPLARLRLEPDHRRPARHRHDRLGARAVPVVPNDTHRPAGRGEPVTEPEQIRLDPDPLEPYLLSQGFRVGDLVIVSGPGGARRAGERRRRRRLRRPGRAGLPQPLARARGRRFEPRAGRQGHDLPHRHDELPARSSSCGDDGSRRPTRRTRSSR